ncbi:1894_t:CDS:2, partial [Acaulospora morrowiae]
MPAANDSTPMKHPRKVDDAETEYLARIWSPEISCDVETEIVEDNNKLMKVKLAKEQQPTNSSTNIAGETQPSDTPPPVMANCNAKSKKSKMKESPSASQNSATDIQLVMKIECIMV